MNSTIGEMTMRNEMPGDSDEPSQNISMDNLYPALIQCFGIILCGYMAGRLKIITNSEAKGLNTFVGTFALPCLIFMSLVELDWRTVNWTFLLAILVSKAIVFFLVIIITLLVSRPINLGRAGILAIFCTQSNDFAIGYPIVVALYENIHPEYAAYLYLLAPISLAILNPIGYVLMEITNMKNSHDEDPNEIRRLSQPCQQVDSTQRTERKILNGKLLLVAKTMKSIILNPILVMTILGVAGSFIFSNGLPVAVSSVLKVFGNSFSATSLFLLGLKMVGKANELKGSGFLIPGILIIVKLLVLPLVNRQTINLLNAGANFSETTDLSTYGFLYGTFPAAPGAFVIATQYHTDPDLIASSMVACTFISAPLMFISAKMIALTQLKPTDYLHELERFSFDLGIIALIAAVWVLLLFSSNRKIARMPHRITGCLLVSQMMTCAGFIMWSIYGDSEPGGQLYIQFALVTIGTYSSRLWSAILAITLLFLQCRSLCFALKLFPTFVVIAWGLPTFVVGVLLMVDHENIMPNEKRNPNFQYGNAQAAIAIFFLVMCFIITVGCLVLHQRYKKKIERYMDLVREVASDSDGTGLITASTSASELVASNSLSDVNFPINTNTSDMENGNQSNCDIPCSSSNPNCCSSSGTVTTSPTVVDIEDIGAGRDTSRRRTNSTLCSAQYNCPSSQRQNCKVLVQNYENQINNGLEPLEYPDDTDPMQIMRHIVLLILLLCSMFVGLSLSVWTLVMEGMSGIYIELTFLDCFLNGGQSVIVLACFISDTGELFIPLKKYWRILCYGSDVIKLPRWDDMNENARNTCNQFVTHHLDVCRQAIAKDKRWRIKIYKRCFYGTTFVDWLIEVGLAKDRIEAVQYANHLIDGRVLRHINNTHHFHDKNLLYSFCDRL